jgi:hypothetical protein
MSSNALTSGLSCRRRSNPRAGRVCVCSCPGWMRDALRYSWRSSQRDTPISTFSSSSTARQAIAQSKASVSREHQLPEAPTTLAGAGAGGEMLSRVQAKFVQQVVRERGPNTRCAEEDAWPVLGDSFPPQTAHRLLMVGKGGGGSPMTSIDRNGISSRRR